MFNFEIILSTLTEIRQQRLKNISGMPGTQDLLVWIIFCYHRLPIEIEVGREHSVLMEGRGMALEFCFHLWSLQQIAVIAGCKTTTSAVLVHCLRQKTEDELMEITLKMVGASTLLEPQAPYTGNMAPGFIISASVLLPWKNYLGQFLTSQEQFQPLDLNGKFLSFLPYYRLSQMLAKTKNNIINNCVMTPHIYQHLLFPNLFSNIF